MSHHRKPDSFNICPLKFVSITAFLSYSFFPAVPFLLPDCFTHAVLARDIPCPCTLRLS